jgi:hypothetical protein
MFQQFFELGIRFHIAHERACINTSQKDQSCQRGGKPEGTATPPITVHAPGAARHLQPR